MADVQLTPRVRCDNCGVQAEKVPSSYGQWSRPNGWGRLCADPTKRGQYPDAISFADLCPKCLKAAHDAIAASLKAARGED